MLLLTARKLIILCFLLQLILQVQMRRRNKGKRRCNSGQWECNDGQCISSDLRCDGAVNCRDGSDEIKANCHRVMCPQYAFQCAYGACIAGNARCNQRQDCADNSDETKFLCDVDLDINSLQAQLQGHCNSTEYMQCESGECILLEQRCDGHSHCPDGSDETLELCSYLYCPAYAFRCAYGACVSGVSRCNDVVDCIDGSDEDEDMCRAAIDNECFIPQGLENVQLEDFSSKKELRKGQYVAEGTVVHFTCSAFKLYGSEFSTCSKGKWSNEMPQCINCCPNHTLQMGISTIVTCSLNGQSIDCNKPLPPGSTASISCASGYEVKVYQANNSTLKCMENAKWDSVRIQCVPICGMLPATADAGLRGSAKPWDVSIYHRTSEATYERICGGVIVSARVVLTAAKCVEQDEHVYYNIVEGFYEASYHQNELMLPPRYNVSQVIIPRSQQHLEKVAALIVVNYFQFGNNLVPICLTTSIEQSSLDGLSIPIDRGSPVIKQNKQDNSYSLFGILSQRYIIGDTKFIPTAAFSKAVNDVIITHNHIL